MEDDADMAIVAAEPSILPGEEAGASEGVDVVVLGVAVGLAGRTPIEDMMGDHLLSARSAQGKVRTVCSAPAARGEGWGLRVLSARIAKCYATAVRGVWVCP